MSIMTMKAYLEWPWLVATHGDADTINQSVLLLAKLSDLSASLNGANIGRTVQTSIAQESLTSVMDKTFKA